MSWVKLDDRYLTNGKVRKVRPLARLLHVSSMCHCAAALNDGEFQLSDLPMIQAAAETFDASDVAALVTAGLWDPIMDGNAVTGYRVHDFLEYNPPAVRVFAARKATAERVAKWRESQCNGVTNGVSSGVSNGPCNTAPPSPVPRPLPDPVPKRKRSQAEPAYSQAFLDFWKAYPRKVSKGAAWKAWPGDAVLPAVLAALEWQAKLPGWQDLQYVKHPATYLNARGWEDEKPTQLQLAPARNHAVGHFAATGEDPVRTGRLDLP